MNTKTENATPRPWKAPTIWDESGMVTNSILQDCQPGCRFKSDTTVICSFPKDAAINRPNAELIVRAVNEHDLLCKVAEAAKRLTLKMGSTLERECKRDLNQALNELEAVRAGKAQQ